MKLRILLASILAVLVMPALAQYKLDENYRPEIVRSYLLERQPVQKELKLSPAQQKLVDEYWSFPAMVGDMKPEDYRKVSEAYSKRRPLLLDELQASLTPTQRRRLWQLGIQEHGPFAVLAPEVQKELGLTESQVSDLRSSIGKAYAPLNSAPEGPSPEQWDDIAKPNDERVRLYKEAIEKERARQALDHAAFLTFSSDIERILTKDQLKKFRTLGGTTFNFSSGVNSDPDRMMLYLVSSMRIQEELGFSLHQSRLLRDRVNQAQQGMNQATLDARQSAVDELPANRRKRLREVALQFLGLKVVTQPEIANELGLSSAQLFEVKRALSNTEQDSANEELIARIQAGESIRKPPMPMRNARGISATEFARKRESDFRRNQDAIAQLLTPAQMAKWKRLLGKPLPDMDYVRKELPGLR